MFMNLYGLYYLSTLCIDGCYESENIITGAILFFQMEILSRNMTTLQL